MNYEIITQSWSSSNARPALAGGALMNSLMATRRRSSFHYPNVICPLMRGSKPADDLLEMPSCITEEREGAPQCHSWVRVTRNVLTYKILLSTPGLLRANRSESGILVHGSSEQHPPVCGRGFLPGVKGCMRKAPEIKHPSTTRSHQTSQNSAAQGRPERSDCEQLLLSCFYIPITPDLSSSPATTPEQTTTKPPQPTTGTNRGCLQGLISQCLLKN